MRILIRILLLVPLLAGAVACDYSPEKKITIAVVPKVDDASVATAKAAALAAREMYDIRVRWDVSRYPTAAAQSELIEKLVAAGVNGILISCLDAEGVTEAINKAIAAGVAVATFDSDAPLSGRSFYIGSDNAEAGTLAATMLQSLCAEAGRLTTGIGLFGGIERDTTMQIRLKALVTDVPDTAALYWSGDVPADGKTQVSDFLTQNAALPVNGVVFLSGSTVVDGPANITRLDSLCRAATDNNGAAAAAVFFDPSDAVVEYVASRPHCAAIRQDYEQMVSQGIERLLRVIGGETLTETVVHTPFDVVRLVALGGQIEPSPSAVLSSAQAK